MPSMRAVRSGILLIASSLLISSCRDAVEPFSKSHSAEMVSRFETPTVNLSGDSGAIPDEYIVVFDESVKDVRGRIAVLASITGGTVKHQYVSGIRGFSVKMSARAAEALEQHPGVSYVEQDKRMSASEAAMSWGQDRIDQTSLPLDNTYTASSNGAGVHVYIIDTGIRTTHTQFGGRASGDFSAINDGNGAAGCHWHGTHVAGTVGGATVGVANGVTLHSVRVLDCIGSGTTSNIIAGIDWMISNHVRPAVANMSITGGSSTALNDAVQRAVGAGIVVVAAAGNSAADACGYSPASAPSALTVAATTSSDALASYSNYGGCVDLIAPGSGINSALNYDDNILGLSNGTSMAAPHVAGAAALYLQNNPNASPSEVGMAIVGNATTGVLSGVNGSPNRLLRVNGAGGPGTPPPPPPPSANVAPSASFGFNCRKNVCTFDASASSDDTGISSYTWSFGDGTSSASAASPFVSHTYSRKGNYSVVVTLTVSDASGLSGTTQKTIAIRNNGR